jgi:hypothetical protein
LRFVFFVIIRSVYQTERPLSNLAPGPKNRVHFTRPPAVRGGPSPSRGERGQSRDWRIVDATIIHAPSSTNNVDRARDPDMRQTRKGINGISA